MKMFEHSVKVPRHYKVAANIFKKVSTEGGSVKTLLYDNKLRHFRTNVLYALITETIKHAAEIDKLFDNTELFKKEPRLDPWVAKVLTTELLFGKKILPGKSKPEQTVLSYKEQFEKFATENQDEKKLEAVRRPRYVRVNTNLLTTSDALRVFQDEEYRFIRCTAGSYDDYLKQIQSLTEYDFTQDYHVKTMFVFPAGTKLHEHELYLENKIILQDKATAMAVHLLAPPPGSVVLDMCAAPGMKATQLAAYIRNQRTNVLYALITETIKHAAEIDKLFDNTELFKKEPRLDPWVAKVLTTELLFGKKILPGKSKPEQTVLSYKEQFEKFATENQDEKKLEAVRRPRYVRVNTNLLTTSDALRVFQDEEYRFIRCTAGSYDDYLKQIQSLTEYDFTQDYHVKTMFVFPAGTKLHEHELYLENKIILQDKATAMAVHLLAPPPGSVVLDMCAAPGMKATQLAAYIRNQGKIYAIERNERRYQTLNEFVERTGSKCVQTIHKDALEIKRGDFDDVEYILLDPSCSGSGMELSVHNYIEESRLAKLTSLQEKFLKHAMNAFPKAKRIVYSTCSLYPEENERVITNTVRTSRAKWRVQDVKELLKGQWNNMGSGMYGSMGPRCMYARPDSDLTTGFFLAVLDRDLNDMEKQQQKADQLNNGEMNKNTKETENKRKNEVNEDIGPKKKNKIKHAKHDTEVIRNDDNNQKKTTPKIAEESISENHEDLNSQENDNYSKSKKKKKKSRAENIVEDSNEITSTENGTEDPKRKKKKRKNKDAEEIFESTNIVGDENDDTDAKTLKKKSKKKKRCSFDAEELLDLANTNISVSTKVEEHNSEKIKKKKRKIEQQNDTSEQMFSKEKKILKKSQ